MKATLAAKLVFIASFGKFKADKPFLPYSDPLSKRKIRLRAIRGNKS